MVTGLLTPLFQTAWGSISSRKIGWCLVLCFRSAVGILSEFIQRAWCTWDVSHTGSVISQKKSLCDVDWRICCLQASFAMFWWTGRLKATMSVRIIKQACMEHQNASVYLRHCLAAMPSTDHSRCLASTVCLRNLCRKLTQNTIVNGPIEAICDSE